MMPARTSTQDVSLDVEAIRADFPILARPMGPEGKHKPLTFLDSAASAQKPKAVLDTLQEYYGQHYANIHRGIYQLSMEATEAFEAARHKIQHFIHASDAREIIFTRGATEAINLVAQSYGRANLKEGDAILLSRMEHHSNIVPWQMLREQTGVEIRVAPINEAGELDMDAYARMVADPAVKLVAITHCSNALGTVTDVRNIIAQAHAAGAVVLLDGCQAAVHRPVDVQALDVDFYVFSGHKLYGPTGIGALYGKADLLESMPPWQGGGEMIRSVTFDHTEYNDIPHKFEAGTPAIVEAIGLGAAIDYLSQFSWDEIIQHEQSLMDYATERMEAIPGLRIIGTAKDKSSVLSFVMEQAHPNDIGMVLDKQGVAIRAGHHCAYPVMEHFNTPATARASIGLYTNKADIDRFVDALNAVVRLFG